MTSSSDDSRRSGSRWEPEADEHPTHVLGAPAARSSKSPRRVPSGLAVTAAAVLSGLLGAGAGLAIAGNQTAEQATSTVEQQMAAPDGAPGASDEPPEHFDHGDHHDGGVP